MFIPFLDGVQVGLAVDDVSKILSQAEKRRLILMVRNVHELLYINGLFEGLRTKVA